jgi:hypothetical protein
MGSMFGSSMIVDGVGGWDVGDGDGAAFGGELFRFIVEFEVEVGGCGADRVRIACKNDANFCVIWAGATLFGRLLGIL